MQALMIQYIMEHDYRWGKQELEMLTDEALLKVYNTSLIRVNSFAEIGK